MAKQLNSAKYELAQKFKDLLFLSIDKFLDQSNTVKIFLLVVKAKAAMNLEFMITEAGPFFFKFRDHISKGNIEFFRNYDYKDQLEDLDKLTAGYGSWVASGFVDTVRQRLANLTTNEEKLMKQMFASILETYCQYAMACKEQ